MTMLPMALNWRQRVECRGAEVQRRRGAKMVTLGRRGFDGEYLHGNRGFTPGQTQGDDGTGLLHGTDVGSVRQPQEKVVDAAWSVSSSLVLW